MTLLQDGLRRPDSLAQHSHAPRPSQGAKTVVFNDRIVN